MEKIVMPKGIESLIAEAEIFDTRSERFEKLGYSLNLNCDCYTCQCDGGCDCVCQGSCDSGPCYGGTA